MVASSLATLLLVGVLSFWRELSFNRPLLVLFLVLDIVLVDARRASAIRKYLETIWAAGVGVRRSSSSAPGTLGRALADKLLDHPATGLKPIGFADDDPAKRDGDYRGARGPRDDGRGAEAPRRARGRHGVPRAPGRGAPHDARDPQGRRERDGRPARRARPLPVRHVQGRRRGLRRAAGHQPHADAARGLELAREAVDGRRALGARPRRRSRCSFAVHRARDLDRGPRPGLLRAGAHGPRRPALPDAQVPLDARGRRGRDRRALGAGERPAAHARRARSCAARRSTSCRSS